MSGVNTAVKYQNALAVGMILMITGVTLAAHQFKVPMIMGEVAGSAGMSEGAAGWMMSIFVFTGIFLALPAGALAQKFGPKNIVILAALIAGAGSILGALTTSAAVILVSRAIEGVGFIFIAVAGPMSVISHCEPAKIGRAIGIWATWVPIGQIIAFNLTPVLVGSVSWQGIWYMFAALSIVMAFVIKAFLKAPEGLPPAPKEAEKVPMGELFGNRNILFAGLSFSTFNYLLFAIIIFFPAYAVERGIMELGEAAFVASIPMIGSIVGSPVLGFLSEKMGRKKLYILSIAATGVGTILYYVSDARAVIYAGGVLVGLIGLACPAMLLGSMGEVAGNPRLIGPGTGVVFTFQNVGMFLGTATFMAAVVGFGSFASASLLAIPIAGVGILLAAMMKFQ